MRFAKAIPVLLALVFALGCAQPASTGTSVKSQGVAISSFSADPQSVGPGETLGLQLVVDNNGEAPASNMYADLFAYSDMLLDGSAHMQFPSLELEPGDEDEVEWTMSVPTSLSMASTYKPYARVCYDYQTSAQQDIVVMPKYDQESLPELTSGTSVAPVNLAITVREPLRTNSPPSGSQTIEDTYKQDYVKVDVSNTGGGFVGNAIGSTSTYGTMDKLAQLDVYLPKILVNNKSLMHLVGDSNDDATIDDKSLQPDFKDCKLCAEGVDSCPSADYYECTTKNTNLISGDTGSARLYFNMAGLNETDGLQTGRIWVYAKYKYCITTPQLTIPATPI